MSSSDLLCHYIIISLVCIHCLLKCADEWSDDHMRTGISWKFNLWILSLLRSLCTTSSQFFRGLPPSMSYYNLDTLLPNCLSPFIQQVQTTLVPPLCGFLCLPTPDDLLTSQETFYPSVSPYLSFHSSFAKSSSLTAQVSLP